MKYTGIQYFFWLFSGSEISVLKECENDYGRHATIGAILLITSLVATGVATVAGYVYGGHHVGRAMLVGIVWGIIVYVIDRGMVISIKKDPTIASPDKQPFWKPLLVRGLMSFFISFFMAIPFYHIFFSIPIREEIKKEIRNSLQESKNTTESRLSRSRIDTLRHEAIAEGKSLDLLLNSPCNTPAFKAEIASLNDLTSNKIPAAKTSYDAVEAAVNSMVAGYRQNPCDTTGDIRHCYTREDLQLIARRDHARATLRDLYAERDSTIKRANTLKDQYFAALSDRKGKNDALAVKMQDRIATIDTLVNTEQRAEQAEQAKLQGDLVSQFSALWRAAWHDLSLMLLVIMLELALLFFEILPTYNKLSTPIGDYEHAIYNREQAFMKKQETDRLIFADNEEARAANEKLITAANEATRKTEEINRNDQLIKDISDAQARLGKQIIAEWENQVSQNIPGNLSSFLGGNGNIS